MDVIISDIFKKWLDNLRDREVRKRIIQRLGRLEYGLLGDVQPIGEGLSELRIHHGAGYRIYLKQKGSVLIIILCGGDKSSQQKDIERAKEISKTYEGTEK